MDQPACTESFWDRPLDRCTAGLACGVGGLPSTEAAARLERFGSNELVEAGRLPAWLDFLSHLRSPLVLLLLVACIGSALVGDRTSAVVIAVIVLGSVSLDFVQERRAGDAARRLRESVGLTAAVLRDGRECRLPAADVVPGDVVLLAAGDLVPADGRLLEARDFFVRQSALTGESWPVEKHAGEAASHDGELGSATNAAFMGSSVLSGSARMLVCRTGSRSFLGDVAATLRQVPPPTAFERGTRGFGEMVVKLTTMLVLFVVFVNLLAHRPVAETFLFAIALAVGLTPELLPMIVSVTLSRGAMRMAAREVVVKRLAAIQNLGSMDVLCTDKTGTLTEARVRLERHIDGDGHESARVLELAWINSHFESGLRSPLDEAILAAPGQGADRWRKLDELPFGFERRRVSVLVEHDGRHLLVVKGAPEDVLAACTSIERASQATPLDAAARAAARERFDALARDGMRVLAVAWRELPADRLQACAGDEGELVFCGFLVFLDPPKAGVREALARLHALHVQVKVVTGDNEGVARHVCAQVGLPVKRLLTGAQVEALDDPALAVQARRTDVFCRVSPAQKCRVLRALRGRGHVVGFLGDGVNDAPSLHEADVGISVDGAVDVAKEAADMILLRRDLAVLGDAVVEGRRTFANVMKYIMMATSSNFGNMLSMAAASLALPFLPMLPVQILLNNLLYDVSEIAIPFDEVDAAELVRPHDWDPGFIRRFTVLFGALSSVFDLATFWLLRAGFGGGEAVFRTGWFIESLATQVLVIFVLRTRGLPWASRPHPWLTAGAIGVLGLAVVLPFTPVGILLGFVAPPVSLLGAIAGLACAYLVSAEIAKRAFRKGAQGRGKGRHGRPVRSRIPA
ncbi:MAG TPA: magnesium-translocating P-type ATPase [Burkholderiaceae bacterium]